MKITSILTSLIFTCFLAVAQDSPSWLRYPSISPDGTEIAFTYKGNIYKVAASGGTATPLTHHVAVDYHPIWSPDGSQIAFASNRYGNFDIYIMSADGGPATRLTHHSTGEVPFTFTPDGRRVVFGAARLDIAEHRQYPTGSQPELYSVATTGSRVDQIFTVPAEYVAYSKDGQTMLYHDKKGGENTWRKHHTSSITRDIWKYNKATDTHEMIVTFEGEDRQPVFTDDESGFYFLSERDGTFDVWKSTLADPNNPTQITNFDLHPVRFLSYGGGRLCFGFDGGIYTMTEGSTPQKVNINIQSSSAENEDKFISVNGGIREMAVSPDGKEIAFIARGEVFVTSVDHSYTKRLTNTPEQERFVSWSDDGKAVIYSSERDSKWSIYKTEKAREGEPFFYVATLLKETPLISDDQDNYLAHMSPDGEHLAYVTGRRTINIKNLKTNTVTPILTPEDLFHMSDGDKYFTWSPDSKWLLVGWSKTLSNGDVLLVKADGSKRVNLTKSGYYDMAPKWVNDGKQMLWFSNRDGMKSYATSGATQTDVYTMFFDQDEWDKFSMSEEDFKLKKELKEAQEKAEKEKKEKAEKEKKEDDKDKKKKKKGKKEDKEEKKGDDKKEDDDKKKKDLKFAWDDMEDYTARLTIHSSSLSDAVLSKDGETLYYLARFEDKLNLWSTKLRTKETKMAMKLGIYGGSLTWDKDMKNLYLLANGRISKIDPESGKNKGVKLGGEIEFDKAAEREAMFDHVWNRTKNIFYHPDYHGVDWDQMRTEYEKHLPSLGNSFDFTELLSEMIGELNVSHAGARFRGGSISNADRTASLGVFYDYSHTGDGMLIAEIMNGGPLDKSEIKVEPGMIIEKIDGETISTDRDYASYLNRKSGEFTLLDIRVPGPKDSTMQVVIKPISRGAENRLLYKRWVDKNRKEVEEKSGGKLGYVHISGMNDGQFRNTYEDMMGRYFESDAVVVDTRFNGGGDLVADLAMFFTGEPFITYATEDKVVGGEPTSRWTKPTLALFNESMYSDGHCFACGYSDLKLGKTVGMPVPGTCSFAGWELLPDGSVWGVVPISAKDKQGQWMENLQTEPTIRVKNMPGQVDKGIDQQLERAISELMTDTGN